MDVGTGLHWGHVPPPRFRDKQGSGLFVFRKCPLFLKEKVLSNCYAPKFELLPAFLDDIYGFQS